MNPDDLIRRLCGEAGLDARDPDVVEAWRADHGCCCDRHVAAAAAGDANVLASIRACMGLAGEEHPNT